MEVIYIDGKIASADERDELLSHAWPDAFIERAEQKRKWFHWTLEGAEAKQAAKERESRAKLARAK